MKRHVLIEWDNTVIHVETAVVLLEQWTKYRASYEALLQSLRPRPVHPYAQMVRRLMDARVNGIGAEAWLTPAAAFHFRSLGLYAIAEGGASDYNLDAYTVSGTVQGSKNGLRATFTVWARGNSPTLGICYQRERIIVGPGADLSGYARELLVLDVSNGHPCGTS